MVIAMHGIVAHCVRPSQFEKPQRVPGVAKVELDRIQTVCRFWQQCGTRLRLCPMERGPSCAWPESAYLSREDLIKANGRLEISDAVPLSGTRIDESELRWLWERPPAWA